LASLLLAWSCDQFNWIRERHNALKNGGIEVSPFSPQAKLAPGGLWLFGEGGVVLINHYPTVPGALDRQEVERLFPESKIYIPVAFRPPFSDRRSAQSALP
jgi:hypothetical protein